MPYIIRKDSNSGKYKIVRKTDNKVVGTSDSKEKAEASVRARYANEKMK